MADLLAMHTHHFSYADRDYAEKTCDRLRNFRLASGKSARDVAERLNMPTELYLLYEETELVPHRFIAPLCEALNFAPWFYLTGKSDVESPPLDPER